MLSTIRCLVLCCQIPALLYFSYVNDIGLPTIALAISLGLFAAFAILGYTRALQSNSISTAEFLAHLALEIVLLTLIFYLAGGAANPFVSYYLVPICIAAAVLPRAYVFATAAAAIMAYSLLIFFYVPIHALMPHDAHGANLHLLGMWLTFVASAVLISYFVSRMAGTIEYQRERMSQQREQQLEDDRLISIATLAASTAHELGTPLNSIHLLSQEMTEADLDPSQKNLSEQLHTQASLCKTVLNKLVETANHNIQKTPQRVSAKIFFSDLVDRWQLIHPDIMVKTNFSGISRQISILAPPTLEPTLFNLLNNAAQADSETIEIRAESDAFIELVIRDYGRGFSDDILKRVGAPFNSDKESGMGIGVYLAKSTIEQLGGTLEFIANAEGTETRLRLPISK